MKKLIYIALFFASALNSQTLQFTQMQRAIGTGFFPYTNANGVMTYSLLSSFIPTVNPGSAESYSVSGTGGLGFYSMRAQSTAPSNPAISGGAITMFSSNVGQLAWRRKPNLGSDTYVRTLAGSLTADRVYNLPDATGTIALTSDITPYYASSPLALNSGTFSMAAATSTNNGYLTSMDWDTFNGKGDALTTNPLSQFASTTSAQLAGVISDEVGTGNLLFNNNSILTGSTNITGTVNIGNAASNPNTMGILRIGQGTSYLDIGDNVGGLALWANQTTNSATNYFMNVSNTNTSLNGSSGVQLRTSGSNRLTITSTAATFQSGVSVSGDNYNKVVITPPATSSTLTIANGATLQQTGAFVLNLTASAASTPTFPNGTGTLVYSSGNNTWSGTNTFSGLFNTNNFKSGYVAKTSTYTIATTDYLINCTSGTFTVTLPTAVGNAGRMYVVKNTGAGVITIACNGAQTIDGAATATLLTQYSGKVIMSDGANNIIIGSF